MNVAVLGASPKPERYSNQAVALLKEAGHAVFPVHPIAAEIHGLRVYRALADIPAPLDTVTVYLAPAQSAALVDGLRRARPRRIILNPGAENPALAAALEGDGCHVLEACTLVLLRTGQF